MVRGLIVVVVVAAVLGCTSSGHQKQKSYLAPHPTSYGYPDWNQWTVDGAWRQPWLLEQGARVTLACSGIEFVPRHAWCARPPKEWERLKVQPVPRVFVHHTAGGECFNPWTCSEKMRNIQHYHQDTKGWEDIAYSFLIGGDGRVYVARGWDAIGTHTKGHNQDALSMAFFGDFSRHLPTPRAIGTLDRLLRCGVALGKISPNYSLHGHRDATCTLSPGDTLYAFISWWRHFRGRLQTYIC